nr:hypothetical protein Ade03nite_65960 [Actinoplanes derwentensis]
MTEDVLRPHGPAEATVMVLARALAVSHASFYRHRLTATSLLTPARTRTRCMRVEGGVDIAFRSMRVCQDDGSGAETVVGEVGLRGQDSLSE